MAVAVPIVSKKSVSMKVKIVRIATSAPISTNTLPMSTAPNVSRLTDADTLSGHSTTPRIRATMVVRMMVMIIAPFTLRARSTTAMSNPTRVTPVLYELGNTNSMIAPPCWTSPPLTSPMNRMNSPMPTPIEYLRLDGMASITASRKPSTTSTVTRMPSQTMTPIAPSAVRPSVRTSPYATAALSPSPAAMAIG